MPKISIIMPVYNCRHYIEDSVNSILNQTFSDFEFIIIDGGSNDGTYEYLSSISDIRILLVRECKKAGITHSLNLGLEIANGEYIARMDGDDISMPDRLEKQLIFLEEHTEIGVLGTGIHIINASGEIIETLQFPNHHELLIWNMCFFDPIVHPSVMMRKEMVMKVGGYNTEMLKGEDYDLWQRISSLTQLSNLKEVLFSLRKHDSNISILNTREGLKFCIQVSRNMISTILREDIPYTTVQCLWNTGTKSVKEVRNVAKLIFRLYKKVVSSDHISSLEKRIVRKDAGERIFIISRITGKGINLLGVLILAFYLNPEFVLKAARQRIYRFLAFS